MSGGPSPERRTQRFAGSERARLAPFVVATYDTSPRDQRDLTERPFFSLSKTLRTTPTRRVRQLGEMFSYGIFDHRFIGSDDERGAGVEDEQAYGFERSDRGVRQAAVEIVDEDDQLFDARLLEQAVKSLLERLDLFRYIFESPGFRRHCTPSIALS